MKKYNIVFSLALIAILFHACREEESITKGQVQFAFNPAVLDNPGGKVSDLPDGSILIVSIAKSNGDPIHTLKELNLIKFGDQYVSDPLALLPGDYRITDFMIAAGSEVLYATPKEGSPVADFVEHPLPIAFSVAEDDITDLDVEVISVSSYEPEEFGYVSFSITIQPIEVFKLSVFIQENGALEFTGAQAYLLLDGDTIYNNYMLPQPNSIRIDDSFDLDDTYTLVVIEPSFKKHSQTFTLTGLYEELEWGTSLNVILTPALTFVTVPDGAPGGDAFEFNKDVYFNGYLPATPANLVVDWGDGSIEAIPSDGALPYHTYATQNSYFVSISGELELITSVSLYYGCTISEISVRHLTELRSFGMGASLTPATIDFSYNKKLEGASFTMGTFEYLDFSGNPLFKHIDLSFNAPFSSESLNQMIHLFLQRATEQNMTRGEITMLAESPNDVTGPPSEAAKQELRILRDTYDWNIYPDPDDY